MVKEEMKEDFLKEVKIEDVAPRILLANRESSE